jgi:hypothetical protein
VYHQSRLPATSKNDGFVPSKRSTEEHLWVSALIGEWFLVVEEDFSNALVTPIGAIKEVA